MMFDCNWLTPCEKVIRRWSDPRACVGQWIDYGHMLRLTQLILRGHEFTQLQFLQKVVQSLLSSICW